MSVGAGIILAGGQSQRFGGQAATAKPLIALAGVPLVLWAAAKLARSGADRIIVLTGANHGALRAGLGMTDDRALLHVGKASPLPFDLRFSGDDYGTAGRLRAIRPEELRGGALLSYTDVFTDAPLAPLVASRAEAGAAIALLTVTPHMPWGVVQQQAGRVTGFHEKPEATGTRISAGFMSLDHTVLDYIAAPAEMLEQDPMGRMIAGGLVTASHWDGAWLSIDTPKDLAEAETRAGAIFDLHAPPRLDGRT